jgi:NADH-quinone oxidoreductase subunit C
LVELIRACSGKLTGVEIANDLSERFPKGLEVSSSAPKRVYAKVEKEIFLELITYMKDELDFDHCSLVSGVDMGDRIQSVYHMTSLINNCCLMEVVVDLDRENPEIDSITPLYGGANYHERETYDMLGILFRGHPNHKRIFLPEDTQFYPLRKDFELREGP